MNEFNLSPQLENEPQQLNTARFMDTLYPDNEQIWQNILDSIRETRMPADTALIDMYRQESLPMIYRDRALLSVMGSAAVKKALGFINMTISGIGYFGGTHPYLQVIETPYEPVVTHWLSEAYDYSTEHNMELIEERTRLTWAKSLFSKDKISSEEFSEMLNTIDIIKGSPAYDYDGERLSPNRFPLLQDFMGDTSEKLKAWARSQLDLWIQKQSGVDVALPDWLNNITIPQATEYFVETIRYRQDYLEKIEELWPILQKIGLDHIFNENIFLCLKVLGTTHNQSIQDEVLLQLMKLPDSKLSVVLSSTPQINYIKAHVEQSANPEVAGLYAARLPFIEELQQKREAILAESAAKAAEHSAKYALEAKVRQEAKDRFKGLLAALEITNDTNN